MNIPTSNNGRSSKPGLCIRGLRSYYLSADYIEIKSTWLLGTVVIASAVVWLLTAGIAALIHH